MRIGFFVGLVALLAFVSMPHPTLGESGDDLTSMRKDIERLKEGQKAIERDLQDLKALLRTRLVTPPAAGPQDTLPQPVTLNIDGAPFRGNKDAKVTLVEFSDYQCPFCARYTKDTLPTILKEYVDPGKVKYVLRDFPIAALHVQAPKAHEAAYCAGEQGKYWEMHDRLFASVADQGGDDFEARATPLRLDARKFRECLTSGRYTDTVKRAVEDGQRAGVRGTPTFFIGTTSDGRVVRATRMLRGSQPFDRFKRAVDIVLSEAASR